MKTLRRIVCSLVVVLGLFFVGEAAEAPTHPVNITPPFADRRFPYVTYEEVWRGTPAKRDDVAIPNILIVYGEHESKDIVAEAGRLAFYLGNWSDDIGFHVEDVLNREMPRLLAPEKEVVRLGIHHVLVVGTKNGLVKAHQIMFEGPAVQFKAEGDTSYLFVGGRDKEETIKAIRYMADVRLNFKSGAYKTFFNFVKLRGYLEGENWDAALEVIESPQGLSACGKNMAIAAKMIMKAPQKIKSHVAHRNQILYGRLPKAVKERDRDQAVGLWQEAMATCYGCHQGVGEIPRLRKFTPLESVHAKHQRVAERFEPLKGCDACHVKVTAIRGYD
jgi:hypothetical protein